MMPTQTWCWPMTWEFSRHTGKGLWAQRERGDRTFTPRPWWGDTRGHSRDSHLHLLGEGGHGRQGATGEDDGAGTSHDQLPHTMPGAEAPVTQHLPWGWGDSSPVWVGGAVETPAGRYTGACGIGGTQTTHTHTHMECSLRLGASDTGAGPGNLQAHVE